MIAHYLFLSIEFATKFFRFLKLWDFLQNDSRKSDKPLEKSFCLWYTIQVLLYKHVEKECCVKENIKREAGRCKAFVLWQMRFALEWRG